MKISLVAIAAALSAPAAFAFAPVPHRNVRQSSNRHTFSRVGSRAFATALDAALVSIAENAPRNIGAMEERVADCGVKRADSLQLTSEDGIDWSVMTTEPLPEGSPVLLIPNGMELSTSGAREEFSGQASVAAAVDLLSRLGAGAIVPEFYLFLKVLTEYEKGDESPYFEWLDSMPRLFFNSVSMTDFCYECLPPLVFSLSRVERVKFDNMCQALQKVDIFSQETKTDKDLAKWAFNIVGTRCWGPDDDKKITPMVDMFNHGTDTEIAISYDDDGNCIAYTTKEVPAGSPLRISYGDPTNPSRLFATYGFLDETSPATFCKMMNIQPTPESVDIGNDHSRMLFYKDTGGISQEVWDVVLYHILASNREIQKNFYDAHMAGDDDTKGGIHRHYFLETSTYIKNHVDSFLTTLDTLSAKGDGKDINEHPRLPVILKHNEFVKTTFLAVKANLDPMVEQAAAM